MNQELLNSLGVLDWGYTEDPLPTSFKQFESWVQNADHSPLGYLADERKNLRSDLRLVYPEFKSAIVFLFSYQAAKKWLLDHDEHSIASYALGFGGSDYHYEIKDRLNKIFETLKLENPRLERFVALDTQPILERDLAYRSGLGWFGKNSMLINQKEGSYFLIGSLLLNQKLEMETKKADIDHCGQCTACIDACPTNAIDVGTRTIVASRCISTYTIEIFKDAPAPIGYDKSRGEIFGCDICQDVCPWNRKPLQRVIGMLNLKENFNFLKEWFFEMPKEKLHEMIGKESNRGLKKKLLGTAFDRPGREGWLKNLKKSKSSRNDP
jgi:epoxyqueuosine reductase